MENSEPVVPCGDSPEISADPNVVDASTRHQRRFRWVELNLPDLVDDLVGEALELSTYGYDRPQMEEAIHWWLDQQNVPYEGLLPIEQLVTATLDTGIAINRRYTDAAHPSTNSDTSEITMADKDKTKSTELTSLAFAEKHDLAAKILLGDNGIFSLPKDYYEVIAATDAGVTVDQLKKLQKVDQQLLAATTLLTGKIANEEFAKNPEAKELAFSYNVGPHAKASGIFTRTEDDKLSIVNAVEHRYQTAEMNRVYGHLNDLFAGINS
jgi:hypothetical protein